MLSTPADSPFFNDCIAASTLWRMGWSSSVSVWGQFSTDGSPLALWLYSSEQYSVHRFSISRSSVDGSSFPLFHSGQVFRELVCPLTVVLPQICFSVSLHCFLPSFLLPFPAPLDHFLVFRRYSGSNLFFLSSLLLSHRSRISAVIQGFFFWRCLPRISLAVSVTVAAEGQHRFKTHECQVCWTGSTVQFSENGYGLCLFLIGRCSF